MNAPYVGWLMVFAAAGIYEAWAILTRHQTLTEGVWFGPGWFKWFIGAALVFLFWHFFFQR